MYRNNVESEIKQPLLYIFMMFILASISYGMYIEQKVLTIITVSTFFILFIIYKKVLITLIFIIFYITALINNIFYYKYQPNVVENIRIINVSEYEVIGEIKGRKLKLDIESNNLKVGSQIRAKGNFSQEVNKLNGSIGIYVVKEYKELKRDYIYKLNRKRENLFLKMSEKIGKRKSALITSISYGDKENLEMSESEMLTDLGIAHVIAVSGLHIALIYGCVNTIFGWKIALVIGYLYMIFTGVSTSTVRAYIMIFIMVFGKITKRNYNQLSSLSLACIVILFLKPYSINEVGFLLSFLATLGIILFNKTINKKLYRLPKYIRESLSLSISTQIFTFPIIILYFNEFSSMSLLSNLIIVPFILVLVILGNILIIFSNIDCIFNYLLFICNWIIDTIDWIIFYFQEYGFHSIYLNYYTVYIYIAFLITYYFYKKGYKKIIYYPLLSLIYIMVLVYSPLPSIQYYREGVLLITYRGERVVIQTKKNIDKEKVSDICMTNNIIKDIDKINIGEDIIVELFNENYILNIDNQKYILKVNYNKINAEYDIIDFRNKDIQKVIILGNDIIIR